VVAHHSEQDDLGYFGKHHFLIRRLHSLSGLVPVGVFLFVHLFTNSTIIAPGEPGAEFQRSVDRIHALGPLLVPVEIVGIFIPLAFHTLVGFLIIFTAQPNARYYRYGGNVRYTLQRSTGVIAFFFILYHLWQMHWLGKPFGGANFDPHDAADTAAATIQAGWWIAPLYTIGIFASVFHLANGIWTSLITWGITIRPRTQQIAGYVCAAFGVVLLQLGLGALYGFKTFDARGERAITSAPPDAQLAAQPKTNAPDHGGTD
jgi:succinate dehydrogenase / fumarate reductase cytochrome b subunit